MRYPVGDTTRVEVVEALLRCVTASKRLRLATDPAAVLVLYVVVWNAGVTFDAVVLEM
jgi:hypothetical protein